MNNFIGEIAWWINFFKNKHMSIIIINKLEFASGHCRIWANICLSKTHLCFPLFSLDTRNRFFYFDNPGERRQNYSCLCEHTSPTFMSRTLEPLRARPAKDKQSERARQRRAGSVLCGTEAWQASRRWRAACRAWGRPATRRTWTRSRCSSGSRTCAGGRRRSGSSCCRPTRTRCTSCGSSR